MHHNLCAHSLCELLKLPLVVELEVAFPSHRAFVAISTNTNLSVTASQLINTYKTRPQLSAHESKYANVDKVI